jgi:opacity protein-like surface antigen
MLLNRLITTMFIPLFLSLSATAQAGSDSGLYLGASLGQASIEIKEQIPDGDDLDFSEEDSGYKVFVGYNFGIIPLIDLAVEGSYVDFGKPSGSVNGTNVEVDLTAWDAFGLAALTFGPFSVFGKAGLVSWDSDASVGGESGSDSGSDSAYGLGAKFQISSIAIRAEYEYFDLSEFNDVYMASVGVSYTF